MSSHDLVVYCIFAGRLERRSFSPSSQPSISLTSAAASSITDVHEGPLQTTLVTRPRSPVGNKTPCTANKSFMPANWLCSLPLRAAAARGARRAPGGQKHPSTLPWMGQSSSSCLATLPCCACCPSLPGLSALCSLMLARPCTTLPARAALPGAGAAASELPAPRRWLVLLPWRSQLADWIRTLLHEIEKVRVCSSLARSLL